jgi:PTH2 family peptidyl-tRNA hydrolase
MAAWQTGEFSVKQVIVVNEALRLPRGKLSAQVAHAAVGALLLSAPEAQTAWLQAGMPKIVVWVANEAELLALEERAKAAGLAAFLVRDAGRTVLASGTITCLGLGPATAEALDPLTGTLRLL